LFWFPLIGIAVSLIAAVSVVPESSLRVPGCVNLLGAVLLAGWLVALLLGMSEAPDWGWTADRTLGLFAAAVVLAVIWVLAEARSPRPLIDMRLMQRRGVWTVNAVGLVLGVGMFGVSFSSPRWWNCRGQPGWDSAPASPVRDCFSFPAR
jgi:peptidoglycan biosynthesis protein MviN/MurJ (putative lipid II flippase)